MSVGTLEAVLPDTAVPGATIRVSHPDGRQFEVLVPPGCAPGSVLHVTVPVPPGQLKRWIADRSTTANDDGSGNDARGLYCCCCWSFFFLIGVGIIVAGIVLSVQAAAMNPSEDFFSLGKVCNITQVTHELLTHSRSTQNNDDGSSESDTDCVDRYEYKFCVRGEYRERWPGTKNGEAQERTRCTDCSCSDSSQKISKWSEGDTAKCWAPTGKVPHGYTCPNKPCVKLKNPKLETGELWGTGVILLSVGFFVLVFVTCMGLCILHKRKGFVRNKETAVGMLEHPHEPVLRNPPAFLGDEHPRDGADQSGGPPDERGEVPALSLPDPPTETLSYLAAESEL